MLFRNFKELWNAVKRALGQEQVREDNAEISSIVEPHNTDENMCATDRKSTSSISSELTDVQDLKEYYRLLVEFLQENVPIMHFDTFVDLFQ